MHRSAVSIRAAGVDKCASARPIERVVAAAPAEIAVVNWPFLFGSFAVGQLALSLISELHTYLELAAPGNPLARIPAVVLPGLAPHTHRPARAHARVSHARREHVPSRRRVEPCISMRAFISVRHPADGRRGGSSFYVYSFTFNKV